MTDFKKYSLTVLLFCIMCVSVLTAQPSISNLADQINEINQERLSDVETLEMTIHVMMGETVNSETTTQYVKEMQNGKAVLVPGSNSDPMFDETDTPEGIYDGSVDDLVRGAESIENAQIKGRPAYKLKVTDQELLTIYEGSVSGEDDSVPDIQEADLWIDRELLVPLRMIYRSEEGFSAEITMENYEVHSGLPVAMNMSVNIEGITSMYSEEEMAEARQGLEQLRKQLSEMPEAQREMIESQMSGQIEQLEQILEGGMMGSTTMNVSNVRINQ